MHILTIAQPWATLVARGVARFVVRDDAEAQRGTVALHAGPDLDPDVPSRLADDAPFAALLAAAGLPDLAALDALPRNAVVGAAVIADLWSLQALEDVATEEDAILLGDVPETAIFWELVEAVALQPLPHDAAHEGLEPLDADTTAAVSDAARAAGARFDEEGLLFWPLAPSDTLAALVGHEARGDREITRRVWAYVVEQDLQDAEDPTWVYLDDTLRAALATEADGLPTSEFTALIVAQMERTG